MRNLLWSVIAASSVLFGQLQNFGTDPDEKKRGEKMIAQNRTAIRIAIGAIVISLITLIVYLCWWATSVRSR
jgi:hypothetical protein